MQLLFGHDQDIAKWVNDKYQAGVPPYIAALGLVDSNEIKGACSFHDFNGPNVELCYWGPQTLRRGIVAQIADFCFRGLKVQRVTARTPRGNKSVINGLQKLGFVREGVLRHYYGPYRRDDAFVFGLLAQDAERLLRKAAA